MRGWGRVGPGPLIKVRGWGARLAQGRPYDDVKSKRIQPAATEAASAVWDRNTPATSEPLDVDMGPASGTLPLPSDLARCLCETRSVTSPWLSRHTGVVSRIISLVVHSCGIVVHRCTLSSVRHQLGRAYVVPRKLACTPGDMHTEKPRLSMRK